jgi:hypothetical protein
MTITIEISKMRDASPWSIGLLSSEFVNLEHGGMHRIRNMESGGIRKTLIID